MVIEMVGRKLIRRKKRIYARRDLKIAMYTGTSKLRGVALEDFGGIPYRVLLRG